MHPTRRASNTLAASQGDDTHSPAAFHQTQCSPPVAVWTLVMPHAGAYIEDITQSATNTPNLRCAKIRFRIFSMLCIAQGGSAEDIMLIQPALARHSLDSAQHPWGFQDTIVATAIEEHAKSAEARPADDLLAICPLIALAGPRIRQRRQTYALARVLWRLCDALITVPRAPPS